MSLRGMRVRLATRRVLGMRGRSALRPLVAYFVTRIGLGAAFVRAFGVEVERARSVRFGGARPRSVGVPLHRGLPVATPTPSHEETPFGRGIVRESKLIDRFDWNSRDGVTYDRGAVDPKHAFWPDPAGHIANREQETDDAA